MIYADSNIGDNSLTGTKGCQRNHLIRNLRNYWYKSALILFQDLLALIFIEMFSTQVTL